MNLTEAMQAILDDPEQGTEEERRELVETIIRMTAGGGGRTTAEAITAAKTLGIRLTNDDLPE